MPKDPQSTASLHHTLPLKQTMAVELCGNNHNILDGLVNGADGKFMGATITDKMRIVWVSFSNTEIGKHTRYASKHMYNNNEPQTWTSILEVVNEFQIGKNVSSKWNYD